MPASFNVEGVDAPDSTRVSYPVSIAGEDTSGNVRSIATDEQGRITTISNVPSAPASATQGPTTVTLTNGSNTTIVTAPGSGKAVFVPTIQVQKEDGGNQVEIIFKEGTSGAIRLRFVIRDEGIAPPFTMNPPWRLAENTALVAQRLSGNRDCVLNVHFYVEDV